MRERMQAQEEAVKTLTISHQDPNLLVENANGEQESLFTDERIFERLTLRGNPLEASAKWNRDKLVIESAHGNYGPGQEEEAEVENQANPFRRRQQERGGEVKETWVLSEKTGQLIITTKMKGSGRRPTIEFERVYDRIETPEAPDTEPEAVMRGTLVPLSDTPLDDGT